MTASVEGERPRRAESLAFVQEMNARRGGTPPQVADSEDLMDLMVPSLNVDYRLFEESQHVAERPLSCPVLVLGGTQDRCLSEADLSAWLQLMTGRSVLRMIEGADLLANDIRPSVVATVVADIKGVRA